MNHSLRYVMIAIVAAATIGSVVAAAVVVQQLVTRYQPAAPVALLVFLGIVFVAVHDTIAIHHR